MTGPRVLTLDLETSGMVSLHFALKNQFIGIDQILEHTRVICFAAKWADEDKVMFWSEFHHGRDKMLAAAYKLLDEADVLVGWNSRDFDHKHLLRELKEAGLGEPSPLKHVDLMRQVMKKYYYSSYKLENVARRYCKQDVVITDLARADLWPMLKVPHYDLYDEHTGDEDRCSNCGGTDLEKRGFAYTALSKFQQYRCRQCGHWLRGAQRLSGVTIRAAS